MTASEVIQAIQPCCAQPEDGALLLHIDLAHQIDESFDWLLRDCVFFGSVLDASGGAFVLPLNPCQVIVEVASGASIERSSIINLLAPVPDFRTGAKLEMCTSVRALAAGGHAGASSKGYCCHQQLQYVCFALSILERGYFGVGSRVSVAQKKSGFRAAHVTRVEGQVGFYCIYEEDQPNNKTEHFFMFKDRSVIKNDSPGYFPSQYSGPAAHSELDGYQCFRILQKYSSEDSGGQQGAEASFWSLWMFVAFLHHQLREIEIETSPIAKICGSNESLKYEFVKYLVQTAQEFAGNQIDINGNLKSWAASSHDCIFFSNETSSLHFLSLHPSAMRSRMPPKLVSLLDNLGIAVGRPLAELNREFSDIISAVTGIQRGHDEAKFLLKEPFVLTGDGIIKLLALAQRLQYGIPVVLMGECGCGKTTLVKYLAAWLAAPLVVLDVHGGTTEAEILETFGNAASLLQQTEATRVLVFLDECNAAPHIGLVTEAVCHRSINGQQLRPEICVVCACNPYRRRTEQAAVASSGLTPASAPSAVSSDLDGLVYRVHPLSATLRSFVFDFGSLSPEQERSYLQLMIKAQLRDLLESDQEVILTSELVAASQTQLRNVHSEPSVVSLRDVKRVIKLLRWFSGVVSSGTLGANVRALVLALNHVYRLRLPTLAARSAYWEMVRTSLKNASARTPLPSGAGALIPVGRLEQVVAQAQQSIASRMIVDEGVSMNQALVENIYAVTVCILNQLPIFVVGKPGTSKTLTMSIIGSNLQGAQSPVPFWRRFPGVHIFPYQCSQLSSASGILQQFNMAIRYQKHAGGERSVLLLDEVGLAEQSPDLPLKVLHGMLTEPPIAVVGLSNWVLDAAKMNRAICLERNEPTVNDLRLTAAESAVSQHEEVLAAWLSPLAKAYREVSKTLSGQELVGMRDFYALLKQLRQSCSPEAPLNPAKLCFAVCRNFSATYDLRQTSLKFFLQHVFAITKPCDVIPTLPKLLTSALADLSSRHLMVVSSNGFALPALFDSAILSQDDATILVGSEFPEDQTELKLVLDINAVKRAMSRGGTVVLLNHSAVYEALYDVLNQRYITRTTQDGERKSMLRLAIGARSQLCAVKETFRVVVLVQNQKLKLMDLPLLNRFEKQLLLPENLLTTAQANDAQLIDRWANKVASEAGCSVDRAFCSWTDHSAAALVWNLAQLHSGSAPGDLLNAAKTSLLDVAFPHTLIRSPALTSHCELNSSVSAWFEARHSLDAVAHYCLARSKALVLLTTQSEREQLSRQREDLSSLVYQILRLDELCSSDELVAALEAYASEPVHDKAFILQYDPRLCSEAMLIHARHICVRHQCPSPHGTIILIHHLPPRIRHGKAVHEPPLDFQPPWHAMFCDDCSNRPDMPSTKGMLYGSLGSLIEAGTLDFETMARQRLPGAMRMCLQPQADPDQMRERSARIKQAVQANEAVSALLLTSAKQLALVAFNNVDEYGTLYHVSRALESASGTLRQRLFSELGLLVASTLAFCLCFYDTDFGIDLALSPKWQTLWHLLARHPLCRISNPAKGLPTKPQLAPNTSIHSQGPAPGHFPFAARLFPVIDGIFEAENEAVTVAHVESVCASVLGSEIMEEMCIHGGKEYLYDYWASHGSPFPNISLELRVRCCSIIMQFLCNCAPLSLLSPITVHYLAHQQSETFETALALVSVHLSKGRHSLVARVLEAMEDYGVLMSPSRHFDPADLSKGVDSSEYEVCWLRAWLDSIWCSFGFDGPDGICRCEQELESWREMASLVTDSSVALGTHLANIDHLKPDMHAKNARMMEEHLEVGLEDARLCTDQRVVVAGTLKPSSDKSLREERCLWGGWSVDALCQDWCTLTCVAGLGMAARVAPQWQDVALGSMGKEILAALARACQPPLSHQSLMELYTCAMRLERLDTSRKKYDSDLKQLSLRLHEYEQEVINREQDMRVANRNANDKGKARARQALQSSRSQFKNATKVFEKRKEELDQIRERQRNAGCAPQLIEYFVFEVLLSPMFQVSMRSLWPSLAELVSGELSRGLQTKKT